MVNNKLSFEKLLKLINTEILKRKNNYPIHFILLKNNKFD